LNGSGGSHGCLAHPALSAEKDQPQIFVFKKFGYLICHSAFGCHLAFAVIYWSFADH
jgi:hypothetical protein